MRPNNHLLLQEENMKQKFTYYKGDIIYIYDSDSEHET